MANNIDGFDPLVSNNTEEGLEQSIASEAVKREVLNILKSYTGYFDVFSELLQNALDAVDLKTIESGSEYKPQITIFIDLEDNKIRVVDNGIGMGLDEIKFCFRPNVSFKSRGKSRGHKGVGATFIAYGFAYVKVATKRENKIIAGQLTNGRRWAEDVSDSFTRPTFSSFTSLPSDIALLDSGTSVEVGLEPDKRPVLPWISASTAEQWLALLRIKTPIGGIYLSSKNREKNVEFTVVVKDLNGVESKITEKSVDYYYPHEIPIINKQKSISEIDEKVEKLDGDPNTRLARLPDAFRRLDAVWEVWTYDQILKNTKFVRNLEENQKLLIQRHKLAVYACFLSTAKTWSAFQKNVLKVRPNATLLKGGVQMASDYMPQGDLFVIPLTSSIGYQNNTHIVMHLTDGNPDMGRKIFQPEIKAIMDELSRRIVDRCKEYLSLMREDTGAAPLSSARDLRDFIARQEKHRNDDPFALRYNNLNSSILSTPQSEQDVIALFHELLGMGVVQGLGILATSENTKYDCIFVTHYNDEKYFYTDDNKLGVSRNIETRESIPMVLEYKFNSDSLIDDFSKEKKFVGDIDLLVCWDLGPKTKQEFNISPYLVGDEGSNRQLFGSTHALYETREKRMEVVCLKDLVNYILNPENEIARQTQLYEN